MTTLFQIKELLAHSNKLGLAKKLNYTSYLKAQKAFELIDSTTTLDKLLNSGFYDFSYTSKQLLLKLTDIFQLDKEQLRNELNDFYIFNSEAKRFKLNYIYINTDFKRNSESIITLGLLEKLRIIPLSNRLELYFKSTDEILSVISQEIKKHYMSNIDGLNFWGHITGYELHLFSDIFKFDTNGDILTLN
jgi:hypothetical protein